MVPGSEVPLSEHSHGTKQDLASDDQIVQELKQNNLNPVTYTQGKKMKNKIGAAGYFECSAITHTGLEEIFVSAVRAAIQRPKQGTCCTLL